MTALARLGAPALSTVFGLLMVGLAAAGSHSVATVAWAAALAAVGVGTMFRPAASLAVVLSVASIVLSTPPSVLVALSGLCAAGYLVCRHALGTPPGVVLGSRPTAVAAVGFTLAGLVAASFPLQLPWLPLAAPLGVLAIFVVATRSFVS